MRKDTVKRISGTTTEPRTPAARRFPAIRPHSKQSCLGSAKMIVARLATIQTMPMAVQKGVALNALSILNAFRKLHSSCADQKPVDFGTTKDTEYKRQLTNRYHRIESLQDFAEDYRRQAT